MAEILSKISPKHKGVLCIISSAFCFAFMGAFVRLAGDLPSVQKSFFRNLVAFIFAAAILIRQKGSFLPQKKSNIGALLIRSVCGTLGILCNFYAVDHLALSDAAMLNKMSPFFVIVFSAMFLRERTNLVQTLGVIVAGAAYTAVRWLGIRGEKGPYIVFFFSGFSCLVTLPFLLFDFHVMTWQQWLVLLGAGLAAAGGQFSITAAYKFAPAKEISVYDYSQIIFSALLGFILFSQLPDIWSFIGYVIICGVGIAMFIYNNRKDKNMSQ